MHEVRKATTADIDRIADVMARAFADDPLINFILPPSRQVERSRMFFVSDLRRVYLGLDEVWTTNDVKGAALWAPPDKWRRSQWEALRGVPTMLRVLGRRVGAAVSVLSTIERAHPPGPHYYLAGLGTDPAFQGTGVGSAVLAPVLARCDQEGVGAYLETSKEKNLAFYGRQGFELTRELPLPNGGPSVWLMWREPR